MMDRGVVLAVIGLIVLLAMPAEAGWLDLPDDIATYTREPYKTAFCFSFAEDYEIPDNLRRRVVGEAEIDIRKAFGDVLAQSDLPKSDETRLQDLMATLGIDRLAAKDLTGLGKGLDRVILVRIEKVWNEFRITFREYLPGSEQLTFPMQIGTCRSDLIAFAFAKAFREHMSFEGYIECIEGSQVTVRFKAQDLADAKNPLLADGDVYSIWNVFALNEGGLRLQPLDWWFVVIYESQPTLVGGRLIRPAKDPRYRVFTKIMREIAPGGAETLRVVSKKDPNRPLAEYSVLAAYSLPFEEKRDLIGVTNVRGEVQVRDDRRMPLYVRVEKKQVILKEFVMLVRPYEGEKVVEVQEFSEKLPALIERCRTLFEETVKAYSASEQKRKEAEKTGAPAEQVPLLREAQSLWPDTAAQRETLRKIEAEADKAGVDISPDIERVRKQFEEFERKRPDFAYLLKELERIEDSAGLTGAANKLEAEAMETWRTKLDAKTAVAKLEEAIRLAPDSRERRQQLIDSIRPRNQAHADARQFVLERLDKLSIDDLSKEQDRIRTYADALIAAKDIPFLTRAVKSLSDDSSQVLKEAARLTDECSKAKKEEDAKRLAAESEKLIALHESLSITISRMSEAMGSAAQ